MVVSGQRPLARLPVVPGLKKSLTALVPDDDLRLEAEGFVTGLRESLVDLVARREVLLSMAKEQLDAGKPEEAAALVSELRGLQTRDQFERMLSAKQKKIFSPNPAVQKHIDTLFADTRKQLREYLNPEPIEQLARRIRSR